MNKLEQQISQAAQALRDKHNATLKVPKSPIISNHISGASIKWWISTVATLCIGYFLGYTTLLNFSTHSSSLVTVVEPTIFHDTIFTTIRDTLYINREIPIYVPVSQEMNIASVDGETKHLIAASETVSISHHEDVLSHEQNSGKSILEDTIHYALLVSM